MLWFQKNAEKPNVSIDFGEFKPGDIDPTTGFKMIYIAFQTSRFYVSIDSEINLNWFASEDLKYADDFGEVVSQVSLAEALVDRIFTDKKNRIAYKKILGDVLSRILDEGNSKTAKLIMEEAKLRILGHSKEQVRMAYIKSAVLSVIFVGILVILATLYKKDVQLSVGGNEIYKIIICTLLGGIGAFITTFSRFQNYQGSIIAGLSIHRLDGSLRVFYGLIAGIIISLAIKGKVLAGFADSQPTWLLFFFAMVAGASEALIPNLIRQAENQTNLKKPDVIITDPIIPDPVTPPNPSAPTDPVPPTDSVPPTDPVPPTVSVTPTDPVPPTDSVTPTDPVAPASPLALTNPVATFDPVAPTNSLAPNDPLAPSDPVASSDSLAPTDT